MQTTLRIDDLLYRRAKAQAAMEGVTLTHLLEDALRLRLSSEAVGAGSAGLPTYEGGTPFDIPPDRLKRLDEEAGEAAEAGRLSATRRV